MIVKDKKKGTTILTLLQYSLITIFIFFFISWFILNNPYKTYNTINKIDSDLVFITEMINKACYSENYFEKYRPILKEGEIIISDNVLCVEVKEYSFLKEKKIRRCTELECKLYDGLKYNLEQTKEIILEK